MLKCLKRKRTPKDIPLFWQAYLKHFEKKQDLSIPVKEATFVIFDTETTGLNYKKDKILSIGAVRLKNKQIDLADSFECFIDQEAFNPDTVPIHGILKNGQGEKLTEQEALAQFVAYCKGAILVGHNVNFDIAIVNEGLKKQTGDKLRNKTLDTAKLAIRLLKGTSQNNNPSAFSLDVLAKKFDIKLNFRHTAAGDAYITALLLVKLISRMEKRGVKKLSDLLKRYRF